MLAEIGVSSNSFRSIGSNNFFQPSEFEQTPANLISKLVNYHVKGTKYLFC